MRIVCLIGTSNSVKASVEKALEQMDFKRSISYTTSKTDESGDDYIFVSREKFNELVNAGQIIEHKEYNGNLYGTPRLFGAKRYVAIVGISGYKALKELYCEQVLGVYLKCNTDIVEQMNSQIDTASEIVKNKQNFDPLLLAEMESTADVIIDCNNDLNRIIADILRELQDRNI